MAGRTCRRAPPSDLCPRKTQIIAYEALAVLWAAKELSHLLLCRDVILFVDNQIVQCSSKKGRCRADDINKIICDIVDVFWNHLARPYVFWVPSTLNIADLPSRGVECPHPVD